MTSTIFLGAAIPIAIFTYLLWNLISGYRKNMRAKYGDDYAPAYAAFLQGIRPATTGSIHDRDEIKEHLLAARERLAREHGDRVLKLGINAKQSEDQFHADMDAVRSVLRARYGFLSVTMADGSIECGM